MKSRIGTRDFSEERRKEVFETFHKMRPTHSYSAIARLLQISHPDTLRNFLKTDWWKELEEQENSE